MARATIGSVKTLARLPISKRTSISLKHRPKNKHARKNFKRYRGQG